MALTEQQKKDRTQKAAETRKRKLEATAKAMGIDGDLKRKKIRKTRTMSAEQKAAVAERLRKAREAKGPSTNSQYHKDVVALPDSDPLSLVNVKQWIKKAQEELEAMKGWDRSSDAKQRSSFLDCETYLYNMKQYLQYGIWLDFRFGENREFTMTRRALCLAYDMEGNVKRNVGTYYDDLGLIWTKEMDNRDRESRYAVSN
jgi:hypothetical protein